MTKCGVIDLEPLTNKPKIKLYLDDHGLPKGDGRCCYMRRESVPLALQILDESVIRGHTVRVQEAKFEMKGGQYDATKRKKLSKRQAKKHKEQQEKLLDWRPEALRGERPFWHSMVVIKNLFSLDEFLVRF
jgi:HIV Tat-specific factor 1